LLLLRGRQRCCASSPPSRGRHPGATRLVLTVNVTNPRAIRTYLKAGFCDTGRLYHGGRLGPQHVLELAL